MNSTSSFFKRARALAQVGVLTFAGLSLPVACGNDTPLPGEGSSTAGKGPSSGTGGAGKPGKAGSAGSTEDSGAAGAGDAGEGGAPGAGGMRPGNGGSAGKGGSAGASGSGTAGGAQGGSGGATAVCGNNQLEAGEQCDDGNTKSWDGCNSTCKSKCEQCEKKYCVANPATENFFLNCFTDQGSVSNPASGLSLAQAGPAQGQPKQKLCAKLVECMRRTNCAQDSPGATSPVRGCFCGSASTPDCKDPLKGPKGPCAEEVGAAAESMALLDVSSRWNLGNYALGMASNIVQNCDTDVCPAECLKDKDISACERCTFGANEFKQSAGTGGDYFHCYFQPDLTCASSSAGQPSAECAATTCAPAADCALATHCAADSVTNCYGTRGQGPCAAQFAAATGSTDPATVLDRLTNGGDYPSAYLVSLLEGERQDSCKSACFPSSAGSGGSGGAAAGTSAGTGG